MTLKHLAEDEPVDVDVERFEIEHAAQPFERKLNRVDAEPWAGGVGRAAFEDDAGDEVPEAAELEGVVGRLEADHERGLVDDGRCLEDRRQRIFIRADFFAREEEQREVVVELGVGGPVRELDHHGEAALHVGRAEAVDGSVFDPAGQVVLRGDGVRVPGQEDERLAVPLCVEQRLAVVVDARQVDGAADVVVEHVLVVGGRGDVHERQRPVGEGGFRPEKGAYFSSMIPQAPEPERGLVLAVLAQGKDPDTELAEIEELARTAGVEPVGRVVQHRARPAQRTYVGKGKLEELKERFTAVEAESLIVDDELDPVQQRFLEDALKVRVVDRPQLILDIFAQHAVTAEGKLQVELAQLEYNLPRMRGMWQHLERLGGGVGTRGPGESQLETDRRIARRRISVLKDRLEHVERRRATRRKERVRSQIPQAALAGYTNVGKSTLLNALTGSEVSVENRLFETLDPTTRGFDYEGRRYLVTDTVGFIRRLPHQLVQGFAATLEETLVADMVLHVVDAAADDDELDRRWRRSRTCSPRSAPTSCRSSSC